MSYFRVFKQLMQSTCQSLLSRGGRLYLVAIHQNNTEDINARMLSLGLQSQVCMVLFTCQHGTI